MANTKYNPNIIKLILFDKGISAEEAARMGKMTPRKFESMTCPGKDHGWGTRRQIAEIFGYKPGIFSVGRTLKDLEENGLLTTTASRIYYLMLQNGMDEAGLAKESNIRLKDLNSYLCRQSNPSGQTLKKLADALQTTPEFLKTGEIEDGKTKKLPFNSAVLKLVMFVCGFTEQNMEAVIPKETMHRALRENARLSKDEVKQISDYTGMPRRIFLEKNPEKKAECGFLFAVAPYRIYYLMEKNGMSREELAKKAGLPIDAVEKALEWNAGIPDQDYDAIAKALNASPDYIKNGIEMQNYAGAQTGKDACRLPLTSTDGNGSVPIGGSGEKNGKPVAHPQPAAAGNADHSNAGHAESRPASGGYEAGRHPGNSPKIVQMTLQDIEKGTEQPKEDIMSELGSFTESELHSVLKSIDLLVQSRAKGTKRTGKLVKEISGWPDDRLKELSSAVAGLLQYKTIMQDLNSRDRRNGGKCDA